MHVNIQVLSNEGDTLTTLSLSLAGGKMKDKLWSWPAGGVTSVVRAVHMAEWSVVSLSQVLTDISSKTLENTQKFTPNSQLIHLTELMLLTLARRRVLGHKVPGLGHLYRPIKRNIYQYLNNSQKKINRNYSKIYIILLKLLQIRRNNRLDRFIYITSGGDITTLYNNANKTFPNNTL